MLTVMRLVWSTVASDNVINTKSSFSAKTKQFIFSARLLVVPKL